MSLQLVEIEMGLRNVTRRRQLLAGIRLNCSIDTLYDTLYYFWFPFLILIVSDYVELFLPSD